MIDNKNQIKQSKNILFCSENNAYGWSLNKEIWNKWYFPMLLYLLKFRKSFDYRKYLSTLSLFLEERRNWIKKRVHCTQKTVCTSCVGYKKLGFPYTRSISLIFLFDFHLITTPPHLLLSLFFFYSIFCANLASCQKWSKRNVNALQERDKCELFKNFQNPSCIAERNGRLRCWAEVDH